MTSCFTCQEGFTSERGSPSEANCTEDAVLKLAKANEKAARAATEAREANERETRQQLRVAHCLKGGDCTASASVVPLNGFFQVESDCVFTNSSFQRCSFQKCLLPDACKDRAAGGSSDVGMLR